MPALEWVHEDATNRQAFCRNVHFCVWYDAPTGAQMDTYGQRSKELEARHPGGTALMNLVVSGSPRFSSEVRDKARELTREGIHDAGAAHVILVGGLLASAVRGFFGTMILLGRPPNPTKVFGDVESAAAWLADGLSRVGEERWDAEELAALCRRAIAR
jgi:hypothetical protein